MKRKDAFRLLKVSFNINNLIISLIFSILVSVSEKMYSAVPVNSLSVSKRDYVLKEIPGQRDTDPEAASLKLRKLLNDGRLKEAGVIADVVRSYIRQNLYPDSSNLAHAYYLIGSYN